MEKLRDKGWVQTLIQSLSRYSEKVLMIPNGQSDPPASTFKIGPPLIFGRMREKTCTRKGIIRFFKNRKFEFDVERALFLSVLHRLPVSASDRFCEKWQRAYAIGGTQHIEIHHQCRAMASLWERSSRIRRLRLALRRQ